MGFVFEVLVDSVMCNVSGIGNVVECCFVYVMLCKLGDGSFN